jgi:hypothetical protein
VGHSQPHEQPTALSQQFAEERQNAWAAFVRKFDHASSQLGDFPQIMGQLREFIAPVIQAAAANEPFDMNWSPQSKWR